MPAPYWTNFRGPFRDGHYRERPIRTNWPSSGLKPIWKQPSGLGYASFVVAHNRAFTIEQRGPQEVVAAYDVASGRERALLGQQPALTPQLLEMACDSYFVSLDPSGNPKES